MNFKTQTIPMAQILRPVTNHRRRNDTKADIALAANMHKHGLLEAITVRPIVVNQFEVVIGSRRWRAAKELGWTEITCQVRHMDVSEAMFVSYAAEGQHKPLSRAEDTLAIWMLLGAHLGGISDNLLRETLQAMRRAVRHGQESLDATALKQVETFGKNIENFFATHTRIHWLTFVQSRMALLVYPVLLREAVAAGSIKMQTASYLRDLETEEIRFLLTAIKTGTTSVAEIHKKYAPRPSQNELTKRKLRQVAQAIETLAPDEIEHLEKLLHNLKQIGSVNKKEGWNGRSVGIN